MTLATALEPTSPGTCALETLDAGRQPVLVALKPYDGCDAALAVARWLAGSQERPLHALTVLESIEMAPVTAGVPALPERYYAEERAAITDLLETRLARTQPTSATTAPASNLDVIPSRAGSHVDTRFAL